MYDFLGDAVDNLNKMYEEAVGMFSRVNPFELNAAAGTGNHLTELMANVSEIVVGVALPLCTLFFLLEFFKKSMDLQWVKWENIFLFMIKVIFAKIILENSMGIMEWIYTVFNNLAINVNTALGVGGSGFLDVRDKAADPMRRDACFFSYRGGIRILQRRRRILGTFTTFENNRAYAVNLDSPRGNDGNRRSHFRKSI